MPEGRHATRQQAELHAREVRLSKDNRADCSRDSAAGASTVGSSDSSASCFANGASKRSATPSTGPSASAVLR